MRAKPRNKATVYFTLAELQEKFEKVKSSDQSSKYFASKWADELPKLPEGTNFGKLVEETKKMYQDKSLLKAWGIE